VHRFSPSAERVLSLVSGYRNPFGRWLLVLQAMVDDSGTRDGPMFLLGALVAPVSSWVALTEEWYAELDQAPRAQYFKLQDAIRANAEYRGTGARPEMLAAKVRKFTEIVQRHVTHALSVEMSPALFGKSFQPALMRIEETNRAEGNYDLKGISSPYFWLALVLLRGIDYQGFTEGVNVVFDDQAAEGMRVQEWWPRLITMHNRQSRRKPLVQTSPDYRADQDFAPLQAANSFAWLVHRSHETAALTPLVVEPPTLSEFLGSIPITRKRINAQLLKIWHKDLLASIKQSKSRSPHYRA
jgi:hypothetical protein